MSHQLVCLKDFEKYALEHLDKNALDYYKSGADDEQTLNDNKRAFKRWRLRPRMFCDVSVRDITTSVQGDRISFPICIAPTAMQRMAHPQGEVATARAAAAMSTLMVLSTISTTSIEQVASDCHGEGLRWFQLYIYKDRSITEQLVRRAEQNGYKAIVLTADAPLFGNRLADSRNQFILPPHLRMANFDGEDDKCFGVGKSEGSSGINEYVKSLFDQSLTWSDVEWLKRITRLPVILKGILTAEDAALAVAHGADGIIVSNHGGRQLDGVPATIDALPEVVQAVGGAFEVYLDGGITTGTDVLKALALGAKAVFIGRPVLWGLCYKGEEGVKTVLNTLKKEFDLALALAGYARVEDIPKSLVMREEYYSHL